MTVLNPRLNAFRPDLADIRLTGNVIADRFVTSGVRQSVVPVADLRREPRPDSPVDTQILYGECVDLFEETEGWCWVQAQADGYVGYVSASALTARLQTPTHVVSVPRTFLYPGPDMKLPVEAAFSLGTKITISGDAETRGTKYSLLANGGALIAKHVQPIGEPLGDPVSIAKRLLETPYLWGGRSGHGIDCSGLVQLSHAMCGTSVPRDTSMQEHSIGYEIHPSIGGEILQRGDLVFWKGHVAMMLDGTTIIHASGHSMSVVKEDFSDAVSRISSMYGAPTSYRRHIPKT